jgi:site-specific recombinase XerD
MAAPGLEPPEWALLESLCASRGIQLIDRALRNHLAGIDIGLTYADFGIADTGTLVIESSSEDTRLATMVSEIHVAVLPRSRLRASAYDVEADLRDRMLEDMRIRGFVEKTRIHYLRHLGALTEFLGRSPATATAEDLRRFQLSQTEAGLGAPTVNGAVSALRFFFTTVLDRPDLARRLTVVRRARKIPEVLSPEEVAALLEATPNLKWKAALSTAYGAGLRGSE